MESSFKLNTSSKNQGLIETSGSKSFKLASSKTTSLTDESQSAYRIRPSSKQQIKDSLNSQQPRVPTIYGMPKLKTKTLPKVSISA